jgi:hypothetical protein
MNLENFDENFWISGSIKINSEKKNQRNQGLRLN